jgi:hypothetical protein
MVHWELQKIYSKWFDALQADISKHNCITETEYGLLVKLPKRLSFSDALEVTNCPTVFEPRNIHRNEAGAWTLGKTKYQNASSIASQLQSDYSEFLNRNRRFSI